VLGAIAERGDDELALRMLRDGTASALGETTTLSPAGTYRPYDKLIEMWKEYCNDVLSTTNLRIDEPERVFKAAISLWLSQGAIVDDAGLVFLQPSLIRWARSNRKKSWIM